MNSKRTVMMIGSIIVGLVAILLIVNYVRGVENKEEENSRKVQVYVARGPIAEGTPGEQAIANGSITVSEINAEFRPDTAIVSPDEIAAKAALLNIAPNTVIVRGMFIDPSEASLSFQARLSNPEYVAVSVQLDQVRAAGGFVSPGDFVNMMVLTTTTEGNSELGMLYQKVRVIAVGSNVTTTASRTGEDGSGVSSGSAQTSSSGLITFEVPQEAALRIASANQSGGLYLTLVPNDYVPQPLGNVSVLNQSDLPGSDPGRLTPYGPGGIN